MENKQYTIKDIAKMAGVSAGTVDRVLHNRGEVSESSKIKIQKILNEIDYQPNMFAIGLAGKKKYNIVCLIPEYEDDSYWHSVDQGILRAAQEMKPFNVNISHMFYRHSDRLSYKDVCEKVKQTPKDGVLIAPNFREDTLVLAQHLRENEIPFAYIDVDIEGSDETIYIGQDSHQSGYIAGKILMRTYTRDKEIVLFLNDYKKNSCEVQMQRRLEGFMDYVSQWCDHSNIYEVLLDSEENISNSLDAFFSSHPQISMGIVFNSKIYQIGHYLKEKGLKIPQFIGYDLLSQNVDLMKEGYISYLIGQRPGLQGYSGVKELANKIVFKREVKSVKYMPIDILMKENIDYYVEIE